MSKAFCIDVSGSMTDKELDFAYQFVLNGIEPNDIIILFDIEAKIFSIEEFRKWNNHPKPWTVFGCGGTDPKKCLDLAKKSGAYSTILISDGFMPDVHKFSKFVKVSF